MARTKVSQDPGETGPLWVPQRKPLALFTLQYTQAPGEGISLCCLVSWLFFLLLRTAGPPSRRGGGVAEQLITNFALGAICIP